jgi:hypothetical protein
MTYPKIELVTKSVRRKLAKRVAKKQMTKVMGLAKAFNQELAGAAGKLEKEAVAGMIVDR